MVRRSASVGGGMLLCALSLQCAPPDQVSLEGSAQGILHGTADLSAAHQAVVVLDFVSSMCTGVLITEKVVLTAAHCTKGRTAAEIKVGIGPVVAEIPNPAGWYDVSRLWTNPGFSSSTIAGDIALLELSTAPGGVTPIPFLPAARRVQPADLGASFSLIGYGETVAGDEASAGNRMTATSTLDWICTDAHPEGCDLGGMYLGEVPRKTICFGGQPAGTGMVCNGDSGGPALIVRDGQEHVAGITSFGDSNCEYFGCHTKVDEYQAAILDFYGAPNGTPCTDYLSCQSGNCKDAFCCEAACVGPCRACNQPGSEGTCQNLSDGLSCSDSDVCNGVEQCLAGICAGTPLDCADQNPCTADRCDSALGCLHPPDPDGTDCSDGDLCNGLEACQEGQCAIVDEAPCDDGEPCTDDSCDASLGCQHVAVKDGTACGDRERCQLGACTLTKGASSPGCASAAGEPGGLDLGWLLGPLLFGSHLSRRRKHKICAK